MIATLRQRNFALLWFAGLISFIGNWMLSIALSVAVYQMTESAFAVSVMVMLRAIPRMVLGSVAGVFVDRWERKRVMVLVNLLCALVVLPIVLVDSAEWLWLIYLGAFLETTLGQFMGPAEHAMLPTLVDESHLPQANALNALNNNLARLIGPAVGGLVMVTFGLKGAIVADVLTYIAAGVLVMLINVTSKVQPAEAPSTEAPFRKSVREWRDGLRIIQQSKTLRLLFIAFAITSVGEGVMGVLFTPFVLDVLKGSEIELGWILSAQAVGGLIGGLFIGWVVARVPSARLLGITLIFVGLIDFFIFNSALVTDGVWLVIILFIIVGLPVIGLQTSFMTILQTSSEDAYRGRVFGALMTCAAIFSFIGMSFAGTAADVLGILPVINIQAVAYFSAGVLWLVGYYGRQRTRVADWELEMSEKTS